MDRRRFLQASLLGGAALGLAGPGLAGALQAPADQFAVGLQRYPWLAGWQDAAVGDGIPRPLQVTGHIPDGLAGTLYRNGPGRFSRSGVRYRHWFDGDGLLQAWQLGPAGISHRSRFVETSKFSREQRAGKFIVPAVGTRIADAVPIRNSDDLNVANTAVMVHGDQLYSLWEGGSAYQLDAATLESSGPKTWRSDAASLPFSAHPLHERDGSAWNFGLMGSTLVVWRLLRDGSVHALKTIELPFPGYLHAFSMTERHLVFVVLPYVLEGSLADQPYMEALRWRPARGCRALLLDKDDLDRNRWFGLPAGAAYHYGPARQVGREVHLHACWNRNGAEAISPFRSEMQGKPRRADMGGSVEHIVLGLDHGGARMETVHQGSVDFPQCAPGDATGTWFALTGSDASQSGYFDQVIRLDPAGGVADRYQYGSACMVEEHRFVAAPGARRAGQGWLVGTVLDYRNSRTGVSVLDAENLAGGPLVQAWLSHTMPLGFHGWFNAS